MVDWFWLDVYILIALIIIFISIADEIDKLLTNRKSQEEDLPDFWKQCVKFLSLGIFWGPIAIIYIIRTIYILAKEFISNPSHNDFS